MQFSIAEAENIARAGAAALRAGNAAEARRRFEQLTASGRANVQIWLLLAHSCNLLGDVAGAERAADEVLRLDSRNVRAMIIKGDCRGSAGDARAASSFYDAAIRAAAQYPSLPPELKSEVERAERAAADNSVQYRAQLEAHLAGTVHSDRFLESLALMFGEKEIYFQKPSTYYFPRLPQIQFFERADFAWVEAVESSAGEIRAELEALLHEDGLFSPYLKASSDRPNFDVHNLVGNSDWSTLHLFEKGRRVEEITARCPRTFEAVQAAPLCNITVRAPSILFSLLKPGARIAPHHGAINTRLVCHLPLVVPEGCGFRVGNETRKWEEGRLLIFDDTIEHEAWNDSGEDRVLLIFDVWRPELSADERRSVAAMFEAIDGTDGQV